MIRAVLSRLAVLSAVTLTLAGAALAAAGPATAAPPVGASAAAAPHAQPLGKTERQSADRITASKTRPAGATTPSTPAPGGAVTAGPAVCIGPFVIDAFAQYLDCNVIGATTFFAFCSDGRVLGPLTLPPGRWFVVADCFPAAVVGFNFI